jgi:hypothetical protein
MEAPKPFDSEKPYAIEQQEQPFSLREVPVAELQEGEVRRLEELYAGAYGERWVGDEWFEQSTLKNSSSVAVYGQEDRIAAAINLNNDRMIAIAVDKDVPDRGKVLVAFLQELVKTHPHLWITVDAQAAAMIATMTSSQLNFVVIEDEEHVKALYQSTSGIEGPNPVEPRTLEVPILSRRLRQERQFTTFSRENSLHGPGYAQLVFQHRPVRD